MSPSVIDGNSLVLWTESRFLIGSSGVSVCVLLKKRSEKEGKGERRRRRRT